MFRFTCFSVFELDARHSPGGLDDDTFELFAVRGGPALVEPDNDTLSAALVEIQMLTQEDLHDRLGAQNVGDTDRALRVGAGLALLLVP